MSKGKKPLCRIAQILLRVRDLEHSAAFYQSLFRLAPGPRSRESGSISESITRIGRTDEGFSLLLTRVSTADDSILPEFVSFQVSTADEVTALYRRARELGASAVEPRVYDGRWRSLIFDPDGHKIEVLSLEVGRNGRDPTSPVADPAPVYTLDTSTAREG